MGLESFNTQEDKPVHQDKEWLEDKFVNQGMTLSEISNTVDKSESTIQHFIEKYDIQRKHDIEKLKRETADKLYVLGSVLSDGTLIDSSNLISLEVTDKEFSDHFRRSFKSWTGLNSNNITISTRTQNGTLYYRVQKKDSELYSELSKYQLSNWKDWVTNLSRESKIHLLRGIWDGEGSISKDSGIVRFTNKDMDMLDMYEYLLKDIIDIHDSEVYRTEPKSTGAVDVLIYKKYTDKFIDKVEPSISRKIKAAENKDKN